MADNHQKYLDRMTKLLAAYSKAQEKRRKDIEKEVSKQRKEAGDTWGKMAMMGAGIGSMFGPIGMGVGAGLGGLAGLASGTMTRMDEGEGFGEALGGTLGGGVQQLGTGGGMQAAATAAPMIAYGMRGAGMGTQPTPVGDAMRHRMSPAAGIQTSGPMGAYDPMIDLYMPSPTGRMGS
jgi:hypothetical protein